MLHYQRVKPHRYQVHVILVLLVTMVTELLVHTLSVPCLSLVMRYNGDIVTVLCLSDLYHVSGSTAPLPNSSTKLVPPHAASNTYHPAAYSATRRLSRQTDS